MSYESSISFNSIQLCSPHVVRTIVLLVMLNMIAYLPPGTFRSLGKSSYRCKDGKERRKSFHFPLWPERTQKVKYKNTQCIAFDMKTSVVLLPGGLLFFFFILAPPKTGRKREVEGGGRGTGDGGNKISCTVLTSRLRVGNWKSKRRANRDCCVPVICLVDAPSVTKE